MPNFYITTTLPYVNAEPHLGFALEIVRADTLARMQRLLGRDVFFNTGTDEHGQKIYQKAVEAGIDPKAYCDENAAKFERLKEALNLSFDNFIRTTDEHHLNAAKEFWRICKENGDIYKKKYSVKYCVGCELEKTDSELEEGKCPVHPHLTLELRDEENYFFRFSKYQEALLKLYREHSDFVLPNFRQEEIKCFVQNGINDFSISRLKVKMPWGVEVPDDHEHVMYVWFDALVNYVSAIGWPTDSSKFEKWWPVTQLAGKDNLRQQAAMWQAMLMSAGLSPSKQILVGGFIISNGQKMSKSLGNVINPLEYTDKYGTDALRYYLLAKCSISEDSDFTKSRFEEVYQAELANGLANLVARVSTLAEKKNIEHTVKDLKLSADIVEDTLLYRFDLALEKIQLKVAQIDKQINEKELWKMEDSKQAVEIKLHLSQIEQIAVDLEAFMPTTAAKMRAIFKNGKVQRGENLFNRL